MVTFVYFCLNPQGGISALPGPGSNVVTDITKSQPLSLRDIPKGGGISALPGPGSNVVADITKS